MKTIACIALALSLALSCAVLYLFDERRDDGAERSVASASSELTRLSAAVDALAVRQTELAQTVEALRTAPALSDAAPARVPLGEIEAAVARAIALQSNAANAVVDASAPAHASPQKRDARAFVERLSGLSWEDQQSLWKEVAGGAELDEVLAAFEERAARFPNDPKAQVELGHAYLQKVFKAAGGPEAGVWAIKADKAFDTALGLDDRNWSARFSKAMSLSHWPAVFGKQTEAIKHFEILVAQQDGMSSQPQFAQTHFLLGNMYQQIGDKAKALAAWQKGLSLFPNDAQLMQQIANLQSN